MRKSEKVFAVIVSVMMIAEMICSMVNYHQGNVQTAIYDLLWTVTLSIPFYHSLSDTNV